ncbi:DUF3825 domain-containing protein [Nodosilinea sp. PGN35]|uniref:DUF3825 domain-containing protein n=1 Tax=Nodosilinea sp. PGN35 TaxID=3020489 RepID=UPI0023B247A9|nr:DUF3825 domain-containing protein [Nodosilinea sp. TSF1-S3]MDF0368036.1 DUF3825 domain-containing protein [Nodosilinea sp. TSF1-S3]
MGSLIKKLLAWIRSLLGLEASPLRSRLPGPPPAEGLQGLQASPSPSSSPIAERPPAQKSPKPSVSSNPGGDPAPDKGLSPRLRRNLYQAFCQLDRGDAWVDLAPLGNALRTVDKSFSAQQYGFARLSELLEAAPDLISFDRPHNQARLHQPADMKTLLCETFRSVSASNDWAHLSSLKLELNKRCPQFSVQKYGFEKFKNFLAAHPDLIELQRDESVYPPQYYARLKQGTAAPALTPDAAPARRSPPPVRRVGAGGDRPRRSVMPLYHYAFIPNQEESYRRLASLALEEQWFFGTTPPSAFSYPILKNYLEYTFVRLQHEGKVAVSADGRYSTFNTGLVDRKYEPIYPLLGRDQLGRQQDWYLIGFCIPGQGGEGKTLVANFDLLPSTANYFDRPEDMFYDVHSGLPQVDWRHILQDNSDRLPLAFLQAHGPRQFVPKAVHNLSKEAVDEYKQDFADALAADSLAYGTMVAQCDRALRFALLKTQLNYKTAVPYYNPRKNCLQLLLPLDLMSTGTVDCALVVDRPSVAQRYVGHTILPLGWVYSNARLICRLETHWLTPQESGGEFDAEPDEDDDEDG